MVFSSHIFLFHFLPLVLALYYVLPFRARTALIAISSYVFYGCDHVLRLQRRLRVRTAAAPSIGLARHGRLAARDWP
jgi:hypothetical protein